MKTFQKSITTYRKKCYHLKTEKAALVKTKEELENELFHLKDELDAVSLSRHDDSMHHDLSYSSLKSSEAEVSIATICIKHCVYIHAWRKTGTWLVLNQRLQSPQEEVTLYSYVLHTVSGRLS